MTVQERVLEHWVSREPFNPYSVDNLISALMRVISPDTADRRLELVEKGRIVASQYSYERILPQWHEFLKNAVLIERGIES